MDSDLCCQICVQHYSDTVKPRMLLCGHTLCSSCVEELIANETCLCPECRQAFDASSTDDIPVNYQLLSLARKVIPSHPPLTDEVELDEVLFEDQGTPRFRDMSCKVFACQDYLVLEHKDLPTGIYKIKAVKDASDELRKTQMETILPKREKLEKIISSAKNFASTLKEQRMRHEFLRCHFQKKIDQLQQRLREEETSIEYIIKEEDDLKERQLQLEKALEAVTEFQENLTKTDTVVGLNKLIDQSTDLMSDLDELKIKDEILQAHTLKNLRHFEELEHLMQLLKHGVVVYAEHEVNGTKLWAKVTYKDEENILLHVLRDHRPPSEDILLISWNNIRKAQCKSSGRIFLDIHHNGKQTRAYIMASGDTVKARQFVLLSTGEKMQSFCDFTPTLLKRDEPGDFVDCRSPRRLNFFIHTKDHPIWPDAPGFSFAEEEMERLRRDVRNKNKKDIKMVDCGLVITL